MKPFPGLAILFVAAVLIGALAYLQIGFDNGEWKTDGKLELSGTLTTNSPYSNPENVEVLLYLGAIHCASTLTDSSGGYSFTLTIGQPCAQNSDVIIAEDEWTIQVTVYAQSLKVDLADNVRAVVNIHDDRSDGG
jgi:hypothetical protein